MDRTVRTGRFYLSPFGSFPADAGYAAAEIRLKAVTAALALTSGAYKTSLPSYFMQRDLFPSLMKVCRFSQSQLP
jgi:hypothetical protein